MMLAGFGVTIKDLPMFLKWGSYFSYLRYGLEGFVGALFYAREKLECKADFCMYTWVKMRYKYVTLRGLRPFLITTDARKNSWRTLIWKRINSTGHCRYSSFTSAPYNSPATICWNGEFFLAARRIIVDCFHREAEHEHIWFFLSGIYCERKWQLDTEMTIYDIPLKITYTKNNWTEVRNNRSMTFSSQIFFILETFRKFYFEHF